MAALAAAHAPCPICRRPAPPFAENRAAPFCSPRCRQVDLGKWLNEGYSVPAEEDSESRGDGNAEGGG